MTGNVSRRGAKITENVYDSEELEGFIRICIQRGRRQIEVRSQSCGDLVVTLS
jgi:hypothetical protein